MIDWQNIDTVLFDMDGTLLDLYFDNHFWQEHVIQRYSDLHNVDIKTARPKLIQSMDETRGSLDWYCLDFWSKEFNLDILSLKKEIDHLIKLHDHAEDFLKSLQGQHSLALVTNAHPAALNLKLEHTGIAVYFDRIISSHQFKLPKEDLQFWHELEKDLGFTPERTLLIEDNISILKIAEQFGIKHLLAIKKPDSNADALQVTEFPAIHDFGELLPVT